MTSESKKHIKVSLRLFIFAFWIHVTSSPEWENMHKMAWFFIVVQSISLPLLPGKKNEDIPW